MNENIRLLVYCLNKSFLETEEQIRQYTDKDRYDVYYYVSDLVHRIMDCYDRIKKEDCGLVEWEIVQGIRFVNNCLKHNPSLVFFHWSEGGPTIFPIKLDGKTVFACQRWANLDYVKVDPKFSRIFDKQKEAYRKFFEGKIILFTLRYLVERINNAHMILNPIPFGNDDLLQYTLGLNWEEVMLRK